MRVIEVGASDWNDCHSKRFINSGAEIILIEPNPILYSYLAEGAKGHSNVSTFNLAISNFIGTGKFVNLGLNGWLCGASSFMNGTIDLKGNTYNFEHYYDRISTKTEVCLVENFGKADYLSLNCNGSELNILNTLTGAPKIIRICIFTHTLLHSAYYSKILNWLEENNYKSVMLWNRNALETFSELEFVHI